MDRDAYVLSELSRGYVRRSRLSSKKRMLLSETNISWTPPPDPPPSQLENIALEVPVMK